MDAGAAAGRLRERRPDGRRVRRQRRRSSPPAATCSSTTAAAGTSTPGCTRCSRRRPAARGSYRRRRCPTAARSPPATRRRARARRRRPRLAPADDAAPRLLRRSPPRRCATARVTCARSSRSRPTSAGRSPTPLPPPDPDLPPPILPPFALAGRRLPAARDRRRLGATSSAPPSPASGDDKPAKADPVAALRARPGQRRRLGGRRLEGRGRQRRPRHSGRGGGAEPCARACRRPRSRATAPGAPAGRRGATRQRRAAPGRADATSPSPATPTCDGPCAHAGAAAAIGPDRDARRALGAVAAIARRAGGPRALLYTGGRLPTGDSTPRDGERFARCCSAASRCRCSRRSARRRTDGQGRRFRAAFAAFAGAVRHRRRPPPGISTAASRGAAPASAPAPTTPSTPAAPAGTVRVIVIDNSRGSLAASDPYQTPPSPSEPWLERTLRRRQGAGDPGDRHGQPRPQHELRAALNVASRRRRSREGARRQGRLAPTSTSARRRTGCSRIPAGAATTIPEFGTGTLGYRSPIVGRVGARTGRRAVRRHAATCCSSVDVAKRDPATNRAPVSVRLIPVLEDLSLEAIDGTLLRRAARRCSRASAAGRSAATAGGRSRPPTAARTRRRRPLHAVPARTLPAVPTAARGSRPSTPSPRSDPDIADFVASDPPRRNLRKPLPRHDGKVVTDARSGLLCAFNAGTTTVTVSAGGLLLLQKRHSADRQRPAAVRHAPAAVPDRFSALRRAGSAGAAADLRPGGGSPPVNFPPPAPPIDPGAGRCRRPRSTP